MKTVLIDNPKILNPEAAELFRIIMSNLGGKYNNSYNAWNVPEQNAEQAMSLISSMPRYVPPQNTKAW